MKLIFRYIIGFFIGCLIMHMGRYKIHGFEVMLLSGLVLAVIFDVINLKSK